MSLKILSKITLIVLAAESAALIQDMFALIALGSLPYAII
jgi:hypothetical protein